MTTIVSELLVERLADWGVDTIFGLPGDGINGIIEGLRRHSDRVTFFLVHHEEATAFMATAYAKATGKLGVCLATSGPGAIHLMNGLYDAKLDHVPVLAITGMQETSVLGTGYQQEVHTDRLYADLAEYNLVIENPAQMPGVVDIAVRTALDRRGVAHLTFPNDVQVADAGADPYQHVAPARPPATAPVWLPPPGRARAQVYAAWAVACGGYGAKVGNPKKVEAAIKDALSYDGPALVDIDVDPNEPPPPGKVAYDQAKKFAQAFLKGQPHRAAIATTCLHGRSV
jgi:pyruvate dehydrogenase (quinone)